MNVMDDLNEYRFIKYCVLGLPITAINLEQTVEIVESAIENNQSLFLSTPNLNFVFTALKDKPFYNAMLESDLVVADGMPLVWIARFLGFSLKERVAGSDLFEKLSTQPRNNKIRVFFFGGAEGVAEKAHNQLNSNSQGMVSCGYYDPGFVSVEKMSHHQIITNINEKKPDFIVVALGAKKGQEWILKNKDILNANIISHLGAVINFVAGEVKRAPKIFQRAGMEWFWRIYQEPVLIKRYVIDGIQFTKFIFFKMMPLKFCYVLSDLYGNLKLSNVSSVLDSTKRNILAIRIGNNLHEVKELFQKIITTDKKDKVILDCKMMNVFDATLIAELLVFQHKLHKDDREMMIQNLSVIGQISFLLHNVHKRFTYV